MKKVILVTSFLVVFSLLALTAMSQLQQLGGIKVAEPETCFLEQYDVEEKTYEDCSYNKEITHCLNTSGPSTDCSQQTEFVELQCYTGKQIVAKERTACKSQNKYIIQSEGGSKRELDFGDFGPCKHEKESGCLVVTCVSWNDGAHNGQFTDCSGGKTCQRLRICTDKITTSFKNSREEFVQEDLTFHSNMLKLGEVQQ